MTSEADLMAARQLVVLLGWDWWNGVNALDEASDTVLHAYLDILRPSSSDESDRLQMLSRVGTGAALQVLHGRALERGRLADDGCPLMEVA